MKNETITALKTPCYVFDEEVFADNVKRLKEAFDKYYPDFKIAYSYKTNYATHICRLVSALGCYSEVVSPMELDHALECGVLFKDVVYNGVIRDDKRKFDVARNGGKVNVDNLDELREISKHAAHSGNTVNIGVRLNFDIGNDVVSRFGIDAEGEDFEKLIKFLKSHKYVKLVGVHCHISKARELEFWERRVDKMIACIKKLRSARVLKLQYIDLGSNMYAPMEESLAKQFGDNIPSFEDYARVIGRKLYNEFNGGTPPQLIVEPGTPLVANTIGVLSKVVGIKKVQDKTFVTMDCSKFNLGAIAGVKNVPIEVFRRADGEYLEDADLVGFTCIEDDVVNRGYTGNLAVGDKVLFKNVGAYSNTFAPQFIMPVIGMYTSEGRVMKDRDTFRAPFKNYRVIV